MSLYKRYHNYHLHPVMPIRYEGGAFAGRREIARELSRHGLENRGVVVVEVYPGVEKGEIEALFAELSPALTIHAENYARPSRELDAFFAPLLTEDRVFGKMNLLQLTDCYCEKSLQEAIKKYADSAPRLAVWMEENLSEGFTDKVT